MNGFEKTVFKVISDTHGKHSELNIGECDFLIHCGDFCTKGNYTEAKDFLDWFSKQRSKYKILVAGNHDKVFKKHLLSAGLLQHQNLADLASSYGIDVMADGMVVVGGVSFASGMFVPSIRDNTYKEPLETRQQAWAYLNGQKDIDILITHVPPRGVMDMNIRDEHCGCDVLAQKSKAIKPLFHVFGHIHEQGGKQKDVANDIVYINASVLDREHNKKKDYETFLFFR